MITRENLQKYVKRDGESTDEWIERIATDYATEYVQDAGREFEYFNMERYTGFLQGAAFVLKMQGQD